MARPKKVFWDFKRAYDLCDNPEKDVIVSDAITRIQALPKVGL